TQALPPATTLTEPCTPSPCSIRSSPLMIADSPCPSIFDTPAPCGGRRISLRRRPAYEDLHSPSPPQSHPKKRSISRLWFNAPVSPETTPEPKPRTISPLRI